MKRISCIILTLFIFVSALTACNNQGDTNLKPPVLEDNTSDTQNVQDVDENKEPIDYKDPNFDDKVVEMENVALIKDELYRDSFYGVPVKINNKYYKVPAVKILNYYFVDADAIATMTGIVFSITEEGFEITTPENVTISTSTIEEGNIAAEAISVDDVKLISDEKHLSISYKNKNYISVITLANYMKDEKFYVDRTIGAITNIAPNIDYPTVNENGLLRKNIKFDDDKELLVREGSLGKMLVLYDIYGASLDITPNDIYFATQLQNIFLHKTEDGIFMFGLMGNSVDVYEIRVDENDSIIIEPIGSVQKQAQNIYYIDGKYVAVGRKGVFGIEFTKAKAATEDSPAVEPEAHEVNLKTIASITECGGDFNYINGEHYLSVKSPSGEIVIYKLNSSEFVLDKITTLDINIEIDKAKENFYYSFVEDNLISIYLMDNIGYIYNVNYNVDTNETKIYQTDTFRIFYVEDKFPVELAINLVKTGEQGDSKLSLNVNGKYLGENILVYGVEDNWVYCSEYITKNDTSSVYAFRYNAITGVKDYANPA